MRRSARNTIITGFVIGAILLGLLINLGGKSISKAFRRNLMMVEVTKALLSDPGSLPETYQTILGSDILGCRREWLLGQLAGKLGSPALKQIHLTAFLGCNQREALILTHAGAVTDLMLSYRAVLFYPDSAESWFWFAENLKRSSKNEEASIAYLRSLQIDPSNGLAWCQLGNLSRSQKPAYAAGAYYLCCIHGDPGSNGCYNSAQIEEGLGNISSAIVIYRMSRWDQAHKRADELEKAIK